MTLYAGVDVHKEMCYGVIMDRDGEVFKEGAFENTTRGAELFFAGCGRTEAVIEAGYSWDSWRPTYDRLEEVGVKVKLAHPYKVRAIAEARVKTDSVDAETLAHLFRSELSPESYVPPRGGRGTRRTGVAVGRRSVAVATMRCLPWTETERP